MVEVKEPLSHNDAHGPCYVCGSKGLPCARCRLDYYCGSQHQREDWVRHKAGCGAVKLCQSEELGRYLVATKNIPVGTVLLREQPLVVMPPPWNQSNEFLSFVFCVGCLSPKATFRKRCRGCGWPVCRTRCSSNERHRAECEAFQRAGFKLSRESREKAGCVLWMALSALRTHLVSQSNPRVRDLQHKHRVALPATGRQVPQLLGVNDEPYFRSLQSAAKRQHEDWPAAARWLREVAGLTWIPEEDLVRAAGINDINVITLSHLNSSEGMAKFAAFLFAGISMIEHSCVPTTFKTAFDSHSASPEHLVVASRNLQSGDHISLDYIYAPFQGSVIRRSLLRRSWSFVCTCVRCVDPTSNGLHLQSVCCPDCTSRGEKHFMVADAQAMTGPAINGGFRCAGCGQTARVPDTLEANARGLNLKSNLALYEQYEHLFKAQLWPRGPLHENHEIILNCQLGGFLMVSKQIFLMDGIPEPELTTRLVGAQMLLQKLDVVKPGLNQHRATIIEVIYDLLYHSVEKCGPPGPNGREVCKARIGELNKLLELLRPFYIGAEEKKFFRERYEDRARLFLNVWNGMTRNTIV